MASDLQSDEYLTRIDAEHERWLLAFDSQHLANFKKLYTGSYESAMAEAVVRQFLVDQGVQVEPGEDLTGQQPRPDFRCMVGDETFYVEVTCIGIDKATNETGLVDGGNRWKGYAQLEKSVFNACTDKAKQCGDLDSPAILAIGTFHSLAAQLSFGKQRLGRLITAENVMKWQVNPESGHRGEPYLATNLRRSAFLELEPSSEEVLFQRNSISGLLLCCLRQPPWANGVRHPNAVRPFRLELLPQVTFGEVHLDRRNGRVELRWPSR